MKDPFTANDFEDFVEERRHAFLDWYPVLASQGTSKALASTSGT